MSVIVKSKVECSHSESMQFCHNCIICIAENTPIDDIKKTLHKAVEMNNHRLAEALLRRNPSNANLYMSDGNTILHRAVLKKALNTVRMLCRYPIIDNNMPNKYGKTPLYLAVETNCYDIAYVLLTFGAIISVETGTIGLLHLALRCNYESLSALLARFCPGFEIDLLDIEIGYAPLHTALQKGYRETVYALIEKGADVNVMSLWNENPLHTAVALKDYEMVELLINSGAVMDMSNQGLCLHYAIKESRDIAELLLESEVAFIDEKNWDGLTALMTAVWLGDLEMTKFCLEYDADPNARCQYYGLPVLFYATQRGNIQIIQMLLDDGGEANAFCSCTCCTILDNASLLNSESIAKMLLERGALINEYESHATLQFMNVRILALLGAQKPSCYPFMAKENFDIINQHDLFNIYYEQCNAEIKQMKDDKFTWNFSYFDLLTKSTKQLVPYMHNRELTLKYSYIEQLDKYPIYSHVLRQNYTAAKDRRTLIEQAINSFTELTNNCLPEECAWQIVVNLSDSELTNLIVSNYKPTSSQDYNRVGIMQLFYVYPMCIIANHIGL